MFRRAVSCLSDAFPRAAVELRCRGAEMENNVLSRPSACVLFSVASERQRDREGGPSGREGGREGGGTAVTFRIRTGEVLPSGLLRALQPEANIMQFHCSLTVSRDASSVQFLVFAPTEVVLRVTSRSDECFCSAVFKSRWLRGR